MKGHPASQAHFTSLLIFGSLLVLLLACLISLVQAAGPTTSITGNTVTGNFSTQIVPPPPGGKVYGIQGGQTVGTNLFHSFGQFNVGAGDTAQFQTSNLTQNVAISNILGRINGQTSASQIFGTIDSATYYPAANLFLMNPHGFLFGPTATVNVGGMVAFTSADYLRLQGTGGNGIFYADAAKPTVLTTAPVAAFGFLGADPGAITVQGSQLTVNPGQSLSLVGGNITVQSGTPEGGTAQTAKLSAPGGQINIASVAAPGEISAVDFMPTPGMTMGNINLSQGALLDVSADAAGSVRIRGGEFVIAESTISADTINSSATSPAIDVYLTGDLSISNNNIPALTARTTGSGDAGEIHIASKNFTAQTTTTDSSFALIDTHTSGSGKAGRVTIETGTLDASTDSSGYLIDTGTGAEGNGNDVTITAKTLTLDGLNINTGDFRAIFSTPQNFNATGSGGNINIAADTFNLNFAVLVSQAFQGQAGDITLTGHDIAMTTSLIGAMGLFGSGAVTIRANQLRMVNDTQIETETAFAPGRDINITSDVVELTNGGTIRTQTSGPEAAGNIFVTATDHITIYDSPFAGRPSGFYSNSIGVPDVPLDTLGGNAGSIVITTPRLTMLRGRIDTTTQTSGRGGDVTINTTGPVSISGELVFPPLEDFFTLGSVTAGGIFTRTIGGEFCTGACGNAGNITINAGSLAVSNGSLIDSGTSGTGKGGNITIHAANTLSLSGTLNDGSPVGIFSRAFGIDPQSGGGGNIDLHAAQFQITNGAQVSANTLGPGNAGNVVLQGTASPAQSVLIDGAGSGIFTDTHGTGAGGDIFVNANSVTLSNGGTLSATTSGSETTATGGKIAIAASDVQLNNNALITAQTSGAGNAGSITIAGDDRVSLEGGSAITSTSFFNISGNGGPVTITAPTVSLQDSSIVTLALGFGSGISTAGAGDVTINAAKSVLLVGGTIDSSISDTAGNAGHISIAAPTVSLSNASTISSATSNSGFNPDFSPVGLSTDGNGGLVELAVGKLLLKDFSQITTQNSGGGLGGSVTVHGMGGPGSTATGVTVTSGAGILSNATDLGAAGHITVDTARLTISDGGQMQAATIGPGAGGSITIRATEQVSVAGEVLQCPSCAVGQRTLPSQLNTSSDAGGRAGDILIQTPSLNLADSGRIVASTNGAGAGGAITVQGLQGKGTLANSFLVSGQSSEGAVSGIFTDTQGTGSGGSISINASTVMLQNGAHLSSSSTSTGSTGNIQINAGNQFTMTNSAVTTDAKQASGGTIKITTTPNGTVQLDNSTISASVLDGTGGGGSVNIDPQYVVLQNNSQIKANAVFGPGGNISITTNLLLPDATSTITASSQFGTQGTVIIQAPVAPASGKIVPLGQKPLMATALLSQRCAALASGNLSSFTVAGRDSLPVEPDGWLSSPLALATTEIDGKPAAETGLSEPAVETPLLSLRRIGPPGFLIHSFAAEATGCTS